jgi:hypothetical protein
MHRWQSGHITLRIVMISGALLGSLTFSSAPDHTEPEPESRICVTFQDRPVICVL